MIERKICPKCKKRRSIKLFCDSKKKCKICRRQEGLRIWYKRIYFDCLKRNKKKKEHQFDITPEFILSLFRKQNGKCYWFGIEMKPSHKCKDPQMPTLDRLDMRRGYTKDNVVLACFAANMGRNETSPERFKEFVLLIKEISK